MRKESIDTTIFKEALHRKQLSINKITDDKNDYYVGVSRKTITRALHDKQINPEILDKIGKKLDVDPYYLSGRWKQQASIIRKLDFYKIENHPYNENRELRKTVNRKQLFQSLLAGNGISHERFNLLPREKQNGLMMELDLVIQMVIFKYFLMKDEHAELSQVEIELRKMSEEVLSGETYMKLFEVLEI